MVDKKALLTASIIATKTALCTGIITATVLAIDGVVFWSLNLQADVGTWKMLLLVEGIIMATLGAADLASGLGAASYPHGRGPILHPRRRVRYRHIWFCLSVGIAGVVLFFLSCARI
jgi:hypothetical protein